MRSILFITALKTGGGHTSITQSLSEQLRRLCPDVSIAEVDGPGLGGASTDALGGMYDWVARIAPQVYGAVYSLGNFFVRPVDFFLARAISRRLVAKLDEVRPDLIVTVHPCYVGSVMNVLEAIGRDIPVVAAVADLDNVSYLWADRRTTLTLCPTRPSLFTMRRRGVPEERLVLSGFPVREAFTSVHADATSAADLAGRPVRFLLMSGSQGSMRIAALAALLLRRFDCHVTIIAGKDRLLREALEQRMVPRHHGRVSILGFVDDVEQHMLAADLLLLRASPNTLMEAVTLCKPFVVIGSFAGQEAKNPAYVEHEGLGVRCTKLSDLPEVVSGLLADGGAKLQELREREAAYRNPGAARDMAAAILGVIGDEGDR